MTKEEFLKNLEELLTNSNIENTEDIIKKYNKRFELAQNAGMSIEETIDLLGSPEEILKKETIHENTSKKTNVRVYNLCIRGCLSENIIIRRDDIEKIIINMDEELEQFAKITQSNNDINIEFNHRTKMFFSEGLNIEVIVGNNIEFDQISLSTVSGDIISQDFIRANSVNYKVVSGEIQIAKLFSSTTDFRCVSGDINIEHLEASIVSITTVSGDIELGTIKANELSAATTSGDVTSKYAECNKAFFNTVSGDFNITGKIKEKKARSVSGTINYYEMK